MENRELFLPGTVVDTGSLEIKLRNDHTGAVVGFPPLSCLIWKEDGREFIHCLELDVLADGANEREAVHNLSEVVMEQFRSAVDEHVEFLHPAPQEYWNKYLQVRNNRCLQVFLDTSPPIRGDMKVSDVALTHA